MTDETPYPFTTYFTVHIGPFKKVSLYDWRVVETADLIRERLLGGIDDRAWIAKNQAIQVRANSNLQGPFIYRSHHSPDAGELLAYGKLKVEGLIK